MLKTRPTRFFHLNMRIISLGKKSSFCSVQGFSLGVGVNISSSKKKRDIEREIKRYIGSNIKT